MHEGFDPTEQGPLAPGQDLIQCRAWGARVISRNLDESVMMPAVDGGDRISDHVVEPLVASALMSVELTQPTGDTPESSPEL